MATSRKRHARNGALQCVLPILQEALHGNNVRKGCLEQDEDTLKTERPEGSFRKPCNLPGRATENCPSPVILYQHARQSRTMRRVEDVSLPSPPLQQQPRRQQRRGVTFWGDNCLVNIFCAPHMKARCKKQKSGPDTPSIFFVWQKQG